MISHYFSSVTLLRRRHFPPPPCFTKATIILENASRPKLARKMSRRIAFHQRNSSANFPASPQFRVRARQQRSEEATQWHLFPGMKLTIFYFYSFPRWFWKFPGRSRAGRSACHSSVTFTLHKNARMRSGRRAVASA